MIHSNIHVAVYGGKEYGKSGHLSVFTSLKHLIMHLTHSGLHTRAGVYGKWKCVLYQNQIVFQRVEVYMESFIAKRVKRHFWNF